MRTSNTAGKILLNDIITSAMADYTLEIMRKIKMINIMSITVFIQEKNAMRIISFFLCAALLFSLPLLPQLEANEEPLIFVGDQSYAPIESLQDGRPEGLNIDMLQALSKAMGRKISIQLMLWNEAQEKVLKGEAHALTIMSPSDERRTLYDFSDPTLPLQYSIFVKSDNMTIHQVKDLEGKRVGVTRGGFPRKVLERNNRIQLVFIEDYREGYQLLLSGTIDAVGADTWVGAYTIQEYGIRGVKVAGEPFAKRAATIAVKKGNVKLLHDINAGIKKIRNDGTIEHLIDKWSPKEVVFLTRERLRIILLVTIIILFLAIAGAIIIWNKALREQVRDKTASLRTSEEKYRSLVESTDDAIYLLDRNGRYLFNNKQSLSRIGATKDKALGRTYREFHAEEESKLFMEKVEEVFETGESLSYEFRSKREGRYFLRTLSPVKEPGGSIRAVTVVSKEITNRKQAEEQLNASLKEKELLLQEIHHRVKNNMQVISSLLKLQAESIEDETLRTAFRESQNRVRAMALVHEKLYQAKDLAHVPFKDYLQSLIRYLYQSYTPRARNLELSSEIEDLSLDITTAIPCGLILNELLSNAFTHAFPREREGTITVSLRSPEPHTYELTVSDDGIGLPEAIDPKTTKTLGLHLVSILVEDQLRGKVELERGNGTTFRVTFKVQ